uniref:Uncharacterized protein n=1 Tax=Ananas comosus var. bracteatus TaxID=296719 RepID=A0A6V7Q4S4_ANACO|nr:unnamed protein product [Ananas comosus var. bracteatus]
MADKPSRALVLYGDGYASLLSPTHAHLHSFASLASCGFLALRTPPPPRVQESENDRVNDQTDTVANPKESSIPTMSERFIGLRAAICTDSDSVESFASNIGLTVLKTDDFLSQSGSADKLLRLLGFSGSDISENSEYDLVLLHITSESAKTQKGKMVIKTNADRLDKLVGGIMEAVQPGSNVASRLHFSVILSYRTVSESDEKFSLISNPETNSDLSLLRPRQSYTMKGGKPLEDVRHHHPMLIAQWQDGVTRKDTAMTFSFEEFTKYGVNLAILADRFLHEVAFKLWKAPKYGA